MELALIKHLKEHGLEKTLKEFKLKAREYPHKVLIKYDQIESSMGLAEVQEARGIVLERDTWKVMCWQKGQNWNDLHFSKKRGSLIEKVCYVNGKIAKLDGKVYNVAEQAGDQLFTPDGQSTIYPDKRGRLLTWGKVMGEEWEDWCDTKIESIRTKWEVVETPIFGQDRESLLKHL